MPATAGIVPSKPPPPNITTFEFQTVGSATLKRIFGALPSTGEMLPLTRQYSGMAVAPVPLAATTAAVVTVPPVVGKAIDAAGIAMPASCVQPIGAADAVGAGPASSSPPHAVRTEVRIAVAVAMAMPAR